MVQAMPRAGALDERLDRREVHSRLLLRRADPDDLLGVVIAEQPEQEHAHERGLAEADARVRDALRVVQPRVEPLLVHVGKLELEDVAGERLGAAARVGDLDLPAALGRCGDP